MNKDQFLTDFGTLFDADCRYQEGNISRTFTPTEKETFLSHIWESYAATQSIDFMSPQAIAAMFRARRFSDSVQEQLAAFPRYFQEEVQKDGKK